jgi:hypothetical protein
VTIMNYTELDDDKNQRWASLKKVVTNVCHVFFQYE